MAKLTIKKVEEALRKWSGNMAAVGRQCGVTRQGVWDFVQKHDKLKEVQTELRETFVDNIESGLYSEAIKGNVTAQIFILKTLGRNRGYVERQELAGAEGKPLEVIVKHVKRDGTTGHS